MTDGYGVEPDVLRSHANRVRDGVGSKVQAAHEAAQYEPGLAEMGILGFVITQMVDLKNDTDKMIELSKEFGNDITDRVEHAGLTYQDIEAENIEILREIDEMPGPASNARDQDPPGHEGTPSTRAPENERDDESGDKPGNDSDSSQPDDTPNNHGQFNGDGVRIRTEPVDGTIVGLGYSGHDVTVHEVDRSIDGQDVWVRATDNTTGKTGWSHGAYIDWSVRGSDRRDSEHREPGER